MKLRLLPFVPVLFLTAQAQDHGHLNVGATSTNQNAPLLFDQSEIFATESGYVNTLSFTNSGRFAGYYVGSLTTTALAATPGHPAYATNAAAFGSYIFAELSEVEGPDGGAFAFWETGATTPTVSLNVGSTGTNTWRLSESDGSPGSDPYGHIHGRRFTATVPGIYVVTLRALDRSSNGTGGGPIQSASVPLPIYFQAGVNVKDVQVISNQARVTYSAPLGANWGVQTATNLGPDAIWTTLGAQISGDDYFHQLTDTNPITGARYYRTKRL